MRKRPRRLIQPMGTGTFFPTSTHFDFAGKDAVSEFVYGNMYRVVVSFWVLFCSYMCCVFGSIFRLIFRVRECKIPEENESNFSVVYREQDIEQIGFSSCSQNPEMDKSNRDRENCVVTDTTLSASTNSNKYEFLSGKGFSGFIEEPRTFSFTIYEFFSDATDDTVMNTPVLGGSTDDDFRQVELEPECFSEEKSEKTVDCSQSSVIDKVSEAKEEMPLSEDKSSHEKEIDPGDKISTNNDIGKSELDADDVLITEETEQNVGSLVTLEVLSNGSPTDQRFRLEIPILIDEENADYNEEPETILPKANSDDSDEEFIELKLQNLADMKDKNGWQDSSQEEGEQETDRSMKAEEPSLEKNKGNSDFDAQDDSYEFEHEDIVQQLKMELKTARTRGLPPILEEESEPDELETPEIVQELKPITIEEKIERKDLMEEIQKVHKRYLDKMKKLDILNFQTMQALGLLQLKDAIQSQAGQKSSVPAKKFASFHNLWSWKQGTAVIDPTKKIIADVYREFEMVYVGQLCLSWEILHWQYRKLQELHVYDSQVVHQYNQVAGEFQLSQVLVQRFTEDEPFQGPIRVQNYVKNRCVLRSLLQVPVIQDDNVKHKGQKGEDEDTVTSQMLAEIIQESMRVFLEFIRADKDQNHVFKLGHLQSQGPINLQFLINVQADLRKKHKRLKDIMRCGNCMVKKFQKQRQGRRMQHTLFIAQAELKLVSRVLSMSKITTDQLSWCHEKLEKISFCQGKVFVEPSFLLLPF